MLKKQTTNNLWVKATEIPMNTVFMMSGALKFMIQEWPKQGLGGEINRYFTWYKGDESWMCYQRGEFDSQCDFLANKMLKNPKWALELIGKVEDWSNRFFNENLIYFFIVI